MVKSPSFSLTSLALEMWQVRIFPMELTSQSLTIRHFVDYKFEADLRVIYNKLINTTVNFNSQD